MKKLITIIIIGLSFCSCQSSEYSDNLGTEEITVLFDMQDNVMNYDEQGWKVNIDLYTGDRINEVSLERTDYGFIVKSFYKCYKLVLVTGSEEYKVDYTDGYSIEVTNKDNLDSFFYWNEVVELRLTLLN